MLIFKLKLAMTNRLQFFRIFFFCIFFIALNAQKTEYVHEKDISYYVQNSTRTFEYEDTCKSYIGFRCVMSFLGRSINDEY